MLHRHLWLPADMSAGAAPHWPTLDVAPRRRLVSVSAILGIDALVIVDVAPRRRLVSVSLAPHWPTLDVGDVLVLVGGGVAESPAPKVDLTKWGLAKSGRLVGGGVDDIKDFATGDIALPPPSTVANIGPHLPLGGVWEPRVKVRELFL